MPGLAASSRRGRELPHRRPIAATDGHWLNAAGCDAVHTLDLSGGNRTTDDQISGLADSEQRAVISKDADFVDSHVLFGRPAKLLLISAGNIGNRDLGALMVPLIANIVREFGSHSFLELGRSGITIRG